MINTVETGGGVNAEENADGPLIELGTREGYPYPLPLDVKPRSLHPDANIIKFPRLDIVQWPQLQLDGQTTKIFATVARPPAVLVIPVMSNGQLMITETIHPGSDPYYGFVAGDLEPSKDKTLFDGARRELMQETGYSAVSLHVVWFHHFMPGDDRYAYTIIAQGCEKTGEPRPDYGEKCKPFFVTVDDLERMSREEQFRYPPVLVNKLLLRKQEEKLRRLFLNPAKFAAITDTVSVDRTLV